MEATSTEVLELTIRAARYEGGHKPGTTVFYAVSECRASHVEGFANHTDWGTSVEDAVGHAIVYWAERCGGRILQIKRITF